MSAVDFGYLESFTAGDRQVIAEVLALFQEQAELWLGRLDTAGDGWRDLAHTIKGASRGIGANALGDVADRAEHGDASLAPELRTAILDALADIEAYLAR